MNALGVAPNFHYLRDTLAWEEAMKSKSWRRELTRREFMIMSGVAVGWGVAAAFGGGGASEATPTPKSRKIGFALQSYRNPRFKNVDQPAFEKSVKDAGFEPVTQQANDDPSLQANQVDNLLSLELGAICIFPVSGPAGVSLVRKAMDAGVPAIAYNNAIPSGDIKAFVARNNFEVGQEVAKAAQADQGLTGNWVIVAGPQTIDVATDFVKGAQSILQPQINAGRAKLVDLQYHLAFNTERARGQAENVLTRYGNNISGFLCNSDGLAQGVLTALEAVGLAGKVWVGGQDASAAGCRAIILGQMAMSSFTRFDVMGKTAGEICVKLAKGQQVKSNSTYDTGQGKVPFFEIEHFSVTRNNIVDYLKQYSPSYVNAKAIFEGVPRDKWPPGADKLPGVGS